jgi:class 3 adenylate cyclase
MPTAFKCPMSGMEIDTKSVPGLVVSNNNNPSDQRSSSPTNVFNNDSDHNNKVQAERRKPSMVSLLPRNKNASGESLNSLQSSAWSDDLEEGRSVEPGGLSAAATQKLFPYHIVLDSDFYITQVGPDLPRVLGTTESILYGYEIDEVFEFVKPKPAKWTRSWLRKLEDQEFVLESTLTSSQEDAFFKGTLVALNPGEVMLILCPDAKNLDELRGMQLTLNDLPVHGAYRDAIFLREHLSRQMNNALKMEILSTTLQTEKDLLESLLPAHAAEALRTGKEVEPMLHNNVTLFFSDIIGFTSICSSLSPWHVVNMLNQLYGIMDHLAKKFHLFKVETIGDAYVCCSGLPESDANHAANVAHFAVAVTQVCGKVLSPLDGSRLQLRIGVHTGACASGIVGVTNPRYCVFGDTVNTTARHESTGEPNRVHCSLTTMIELMQRAPQDFNLISRGLVEMKGKGAQPTYWLESSKENKHTGEKGMITLDDEITTKFADILARREQEDMVIPERRVVASPAKGHIRRGLTSKRSKRKILSLAGLADLDDDDDDFLTVSTTSNSTRGEASGDTLSGEYSFDTLSGEYSETLSNYSSASPSRSQLARLVKSNRQRPKASKERHDADLVKAIEHVEAGMSSRT